METTNLVLVQEFCTLNGIELSFIYSLHEVGLVEIVIADEQKYIAHEQLKSLEKMIHFHYEMNINIEGIDVIQNLLNQIDRLQHELRIANSRLSGLTERST